MINHDEFYMWRALLAFAFALSDHLLSVEKKHILTSHMKEADFSHEQLAIIKNDMHTPHRTEYFFKNISNKKYKIRFCELARTLAWCDGDISLQEKEILKRISCFKNPEHASILKESRDTDFIKNFTKLYEKMAFINDKRSFHLFEQIA